jgi:cytochrome c
MLTRTIAILLGALAATPALADGDVEAGKVVFKQCAICHTIEPGKKKIGPSLFGVVGRKAGTEPYFDYSPAMKASGKVWDEATLFVYLANPRALVPGTKMSFAGLKDETARHNVIAYLATLK